MWLTKDRNGAVCLWIDGPKPKYNIYGEWSGYGNSVEDPSGHWEKMALALPEGSIQKVTLREVV
jgi:hypothetical protein